jgi:hydrogenase expression/formation protein HypD
VGYVDHALALARLPDVIITTFGDMVRVPGSSGSLADEQARGARVQVVFSSLDALKLARARPDAQVIFLAVGFETTAPTVAATLKRAAAEGVPNFSVLCAHKTIPQALAFLAAPARATLNGLLCPPHVSAIIGTRPYEAIAARGIPCVVGGFEPLDILLAAAMLLEQRAASVARVENEYSRVVRPEGNPRALALLDEIFEPCDATWRGLGPLPGSGLRLRPRLARFDAARRFAVEVPEAREPAGCRCGEILMGTIDPTDCPLFGTTCTPDDPVGACMVSSEGTCAARYRYGVQP